MDSKEYKISEITEIIGASKATIYNKIQCFQDILRKHIKVRKGVKYIDSIGMEIIKNSIGLSKGKFENEEEASNRTNIAGLFEKLEDNKKYIDNLEGQIEFLKSDNIFLKEYLVKEIEAKNKQLEAKDQLLQNFQVLLREQKNILEAPKKNFFQKIFRNFQK
jgi:hypothetical protein